MNFTLLNKDTICIKVHVMYCYPSERTKLFWILEIGVRLLINGTSSEFLSTTVLQFPVF